MTSTHVSGPAPHSTYDDSPWTSVPLPPAPGRLPWRASLAVAGAFGLLLATVLFQGGGGDLSGLALASGATLAVLAAGVVLIAGGRLPLPRPAGVLVLALAGLAFWGLAAFASMRWSLAPALSYVDGTRVLAALAFVVLGVGLGGLLTRSTEAVAFALAASAVPVVAWALVQRSFDRFGHLQETPSRLEGSLHYPNALGILCAVSALLALWLATRRAVALRAWGGGLLALCVYALSLTGSRGSLLALLLGGGLWLWLEPRRLETVAALVAALVPAAIASAWASTLTTFTTVTSQRPPAAGAGFLFAGALATLAAAGLTVVALAALDRLAASTRRRAGRALAGAAAALVVLALLAVVVRDGGPAGAVRHAWQGVAGSNAVNNTGGGFRLAAGGSNLRGRWWSEAWQAFRARPAEGVGADTFRIVDQLTRPDYTPVREPHNAGLQVLAGLGLAGGVPALLALVGSLAAAALGLRRLRGEARSAGAALFAVIAAFALHNLLDWDWIFVGLTLAVYPLAGVLAAAARDPQPAGRAVRPLALGSLPVLAAAAVCCLLPFLGQRAMDRTTALSVAGRHDEALVEADLAVSLLPFSTDALLQRANVEQALGRTTDARADVEHALRLEPLTAQVWAAAGVLQRDCLGEVTRGRRTLARAAALSGHSAFLATEAKLGPGPCAAAVASG